MSKSNTQHKAGRKASQTAPKKRAPDKGGNRAPKSARRGYLQSHLARSNRRRRWRSGQSPKVVDEAQAYGIRAQADHHDRDLGRRPLGGARRNVVRSDDHVSTPADKVVCQSRELIQAAFRAHDSEGEIASLLVFQLSEIRSVPI